MSYNLPDMGLFFLGLFSMKKKALMGGVWMSSFIIQWFLPFLGYEFLFSYFFKLWGNLAN
jgi:hypothetical protein